MQVRKRQSAEVLSWVRSSGMKSCVVLGESCDLLVSGQQATWGSVLAGQVSGNSPVPCLWGGPRSTWCSPSCCPCRQAALQRGSWRLDLLFPDYLANIPEWPCQGEWLRASCSPGRVGTGYGAGKGVPSGLGMRPHAAPCIVWFNPCDGTILFL